ncbi:MAG TPA: DUF2332 family protein, partial [Actinomycetes bacterium]|nr:DUF2332 family protein [Actinomycetes bacterium]
MVDIADRFERQARACAALGSPMYSFLLSRCAGDIRAGGPTAKLLSGVPPLPENAVIALRVMGGVHALVLNREAPRLALHYP